MGLPGWGSAHPMGMHPTDKNGGSLLGSLQTPPQCLAHTLGDSFITVGKKQLVGGRGLEETNHLIYIFKYILPRTFFFLVTTSSENKINQ